MFVRMKTGAYIGEVREMPFVIGRDLIANGRAERVDFSSIPAPAPAPEPSEAPPSKTKRRKK